MAIVQGGGTAYELRGLTNQLMLASLDTVMPQIQVDVSAPIQLQGVPVSQGFSALKGHESQLRAQKVKQIYTNQVLHFSGSTNLSLEVGTLIVHTQLIYMGHYM